MALFVAACFSMSGGPGRTALTIHNRTLEPVVVEVTGQLTWAGMVPACGTWAIEGSSPTFAATLPTGVVPFSFHIRTPAEGGLFVAIIAEGGVSFDSGTDAPTIPPCSGTAPEPSREPEP